MGERYVVVATHNTGHGEVSNPVMITSDIVKAIAAARTVEELGFQFYDNEVGVVVYRLFEDSCYRKNDFTGYIGHLPPRTLVFSRRHYDWRATLCKKGDWEEEWFDDQLRQKVDGRVSARGKK